MKSGPRWMQRCACGHMWMDHDIEEFQGDGSDLCCVVGCDQRGCPGRAAKEEVHAPQT